MDKFGGFNKSSDREISTQYLRCPINSKLCCPINLNYSNEKKVIVKLAKNENKNKKHPKVLEVSFFFVVLRKFIHISYESFITIDARSNCDIFRSFFSKFIKIIQILANESTYSLNAQTCKTFSKDEQ